jgi:hypothetical protein
MIAPFVDRGAGIRIQRVPLESSQLANAVGLKSVRELETAAEMARGV